LTVKEALTAMATTKPRGRPPGPRTWDGQLPSPEEQRGLKEEAILECAGRWFQRHGFHGASLADIAQELGVTKAALYHYASGKSELLFKLHMRSLAAAKSAREQAVQEGSDGMDRIARLVYNVVLLMTGSVTNTFILVEPGTLDPPHWEAVAGERRWLEHDLRDLVQQGIEDGSIVPCDPKLVAFLIIGAQNWVVNWYRAGGSWTGHQVAYGYARLVRRMLGKRRAGAMPTALADCPPTIGFDAPC
jgi:TetR/AcrR family transcriptional regulator